ncbi:nose resistant to fluoxetine protein 6-like [Lineus longissimus]|uniref:nose resistant to fluoxetine protein 6-like n=1 Tax=Lineus longissimus TaxID=88925 RepID=UPI002B4F115F
MRKLTNFCHHVFLFVGQIFLVVVCTAGLAPEQKMDIPQPLINNEANLNPSLPKSYPLDWLNTLQRNLPTLPQLLNQLKIDKFNVSETCLNDTEQTIDDILAGQTYAAQMLDATAKIPSGITQGNIRWAGDYVGCLAVTSTTMGRGQEFKGKYCTASLPQKLIPGLAMTYSVCVPGSCSELDVRGLLYSVIATVNNQTIILEVDCSGPVAYDTAAVVSLVIVFILLAFVIIGTLYDLFHRNRTCFNLTEPIQINEEKHGVDEERIGLLTGVAPQNLYSDVNTVPRREQTTFDKFLLSFSAVANATKILSTDSPPSSIGMLHGLRVLSMWWVILGHTHLMHFGNMNNILSAAQSLFQKCLGQTITHATFSVDTFFVLSGLLVTYLCLKEMKAKDGKINWPLFYFHRFWRLTPAYMFCIMFFTNLIQYVAPGPGTGIGGFGNENCKDWWWTNLLYINNFVPLNNGKMCFAWAWYLANDMQFYIISPIILILLYRWKYVGIGVCASLSFACIIARGVISSHYGQMGIDLIGVPAVAPRNLYTNAAGFDYIYGKPYTRICTYLIGMVMGFILHKTECKKVFHFKKLYVWIGWILSIALGLSLVYGLYYDEKHQIPIGYDLQALYVALSRFVWGLAVAWVIFACVHGMGGPINKFLSWRFWIPLSRLTYCAYLVHPIWIAIYVHYQRAPTHYDDITMVYLYVGNLFFSYVIAFGTSLLIEAPMIGIEKVIFKR